MDLHINNNYGSVIENKEGGVLNIYQDHSGRWQVKAVTVEDALVVKDAAEETAQPDERVVNQKEPLSAKRQSIMDRLDKWIRLGEWVKPATAENIQKMMRDVLNQGDYALQGVDREMSEALWNLLEHRKGDAVRVTWQNLIGYYIYNRLLPLVGSPKLQEMFFGSIDDYTNIDKGKPDSHFMPEGFRQIIPLLDKYRPK